jgi:uncharacterized protein (TIGR03083 family)
MIEVCHALATSEWRLDTDCPGWTVQDQLSHLIGIERMIIGQEAPEAAGPLGDHVKSDFAALNERWIVARRPWEGDAVLEEFAEITAVRLQSLDELGDGDWARVGFSPVGQVPYARFMETRVFDSWVHEQDVRAALDRPGGEGGLASALGLGQVQAAMGFVVGKKAAAPEGSTVRFSISGTGDDARDFTIGVTGGRAAELPAQGGPTVTLSMSSLDFLRLGCGRVEAATMGTTMGTGTLEAAGRIGVAGDAVLAQRILANMNFMF